MKYRYLVVIERFKLTGKGKEFVKMSEGAYESKVKVESTFMNISVAAKDFDEAHVLSKKFIINDDELVAIIQKEPIINI